MKQEAKSLLNLNHCNIIKFYGILSRHCAILTEILEKQIVVDDCEYMKIHIFEPRKK